LDSPASKSVSSLSGTRYKAELPSNGDPPAGNSSGGNSSNGEAPDAVKLPANGREAALLVKTRRGDRSAYGQIVVLYQDRLFNALLRMVGETEEARELTQETFARGLEKIDTFRGEASPYTWLFRIGMNLAISNLRRSQRVRVFSLDAGDYGGNGSRGESPRGKDQAAALIDRVASAKGDSPQQAMERNELHQVVVDALGRLDAEYRAVLVMRDVEGFDYQQMADVLALPLGTLKSRLFRARMALKDELGPYLADYKSKKKRES
jgi:RNA polymerase sigma-70 factor (ECF subfamily)